MEAMLCSMPNASISGRPNFGSSGRGGAMVERDRLSPMAWIRLP